MQEMICNILMAGTIIITSPIAAAAVLLIAYILRSDHR